MGSIGDCFDNAVVESFWGRMQVELLNRRRWKSRVELANAIFECLEIFHNLLPPEDNFGGCLWANAVARPVVDVSPNPSRNDRPTEETVSHFTLPWSRWGTSAPPT